MIKAVFDLYQKILSPIIHFLGKTLFGPHFACRFTPSCSEYTRVAISRYGMIQGTVMGFKRLIRCNPLFTGGYDPVPDKI